MARRTRRNRRVPATPARRWYESAALKWIGSTFTLVLVGVLVGVFGNYAQQRLFPPASPSVGTPSGAAQTGEGSTAPSAAKSPQNDAPFTVAVSAAGYACNGGWMTKQTPAELTPLMEPGDVPPDWHTWATTADAFPASNVYVRLVIQGTSDAEVTIHNIRPVVVKRDPPPTGTHVQEGCGGDKIYRWLAVDLDTDPPTRTAELQEEFFEDAEPQERRPIRFPYGVSLKDSESFLIIGSVTRGDVHWNIEIDWSSQGRTGKYVANNNGRDFRVASASAAAAKCLFLAGGDSPTGADQPCSQSD